MKKIFFLRLVFKVAALQRLWETGRSRRQIIAGGKALPSSSRGKETFYGEVEEEEEKGPLKSRAEIRRHSSGGEGGGGGIFLYIGGERGGVETENVFSSLLIAGGNVEGP